LEAVEEIEFLDQIDEWMMGEMMKEEEIRLIYLRFLVPLPPQIASFLVLHIGEDGRQSRDERHAMANSHVDSTERVFLVLQDTTQR
jgi:hypothetical protein